MNLTESLEAMSFQALIYKITTFQQKKLINSKIVKNQKINLVIRKRE